MVRQNVRTLRTTMLLLPGYWFTVMSFTGRELSIMIQRFFFLAFID